MAKEQELGHCLRATKVELPSKWYNYVVPNCPAKLTTILGEKVDIDAVIHDEVVAQTGIRPTSVRQSKHGPYVETNRGSWIVSFMKEVDAWDPGGSCDLPLTGKRLVSRYYSTIEYIVKCLRRKSAIEKGARPDAYKPPSVMFRMQPSCLYRYSG